MSDLEHKATLEARNRVASRFVQGYHKRAILSGDWDGGSLVRNERAKVLEDKEWLDRQSRSSSEPS